MPVNRRRSLLFIALITAIGCGGSQSGGDQNGGGGQNGGLDAGSGGGGDGGTPVFSEATRGAAIKAVEAKLANLLARDGSVDTASLHAYMASRPEFSHVTDAPDGSVYGFFPDGAFYVAIANRKLAGTGANATVKRSIASKRVQRGVSTDGTELAPTDQVRLVNALGVKGFTDSTSDIADMVSSRGYTPVTGNLDVEEMKTWNGDGAIYISSHGELMPLQDGGVPEPVLWTSTPYVEGDTTYEAELLPDSDGHILMGISSAEYDLDAQGSPIVESHYVVTGRWIEKHMHFAPGSFVQLDVCFGGLLEASLHNAGADVIGGWANAVADGDGARVDKFVFDRFLGANQYEPQTPPQRPFDVGPVGDDLTNRGWDVSESGAVYSLIGGDSFALLSPSIENMTVDEQAGRLTLNGIFGTQDDSSMVTVGGTELSNCDWQPEKVICDIEPGFSGDVVASKRDHDSNAVPLTEWTGTVDYKETNDFSSMVAEVKLQVSFRADVHAYRTTSGGDPIKPTAAVFASEKQVSVVNYQGSGQACGASGCEQLVGSGELGQVFVPGSFPPPGFSDSYFFHGVADVEHGTVTIQYMAFSTTGMTVAAPGAAIPFQVQVVPSLVINGPGGSSLDWNLAMNDDFNIPDGSAQRVVPGNTGNATLELTWHFDTVKNAPITSKGEDDNAP
jgi:hypothetical protein